MEVKVSGGFGVFSFLLLLTTCVNQCKTHDRVLDISRKVNDKPCEVVKEVE